MRARRSRPQDPEPKQMLPTSQPWWHPGPWPTSMAFHPRHRLGGAAVQLRLHRIAACSTGRRGQDTPRQARTAFQTPQRVRTKRVGARLVFTMPPVPDFFFGSAPNRLPNDSPVEVKAGSGTLRAITITPNGAEGPVSIRASGY